MKNVKNMKKNTIDKKDADGSNELFKMYLLETMDYIHSLCEKHNIHYSIFFGTLLGAARHKGFIPWDDDIDIVMPRDDYNRFIEIVNDSTSNFFVVTHELNRDYYLPFAKVCNKKATLFEHVSKPVKLGPYVDVFPLDYCEDSLEQSLSLVKTLFKKQRRLTVKNLIIGKNRSFWKNCLLVVLKTFLLFQSKHSIIKSINRIATKNLGKPKKYSSCLCFAVYKEKALYESCLFSELILLDFEGRKYWAPKSFSSILTKTYGNYLELPPIEKRVTHHGFTVFFEDNNTSA